MKCEVCEEEFEKEKLINGVCPDCYAEIQARLEKKKNVLNEIKKESEKTENVLSEIKTENTISMYDTEPDNNVADTINVMNIILLGLSLTGAVVSIFFSFLGEEFETIYLIYGFLWIIISLTIYTLLKGFVEIIRLLDKISKKK